MSVLRRFATVLTVLAVSAFVPPQAADAAGPTAPYDAFTIEGGEFSGAYDRSNTLFEIEDHSMPTREAYEMVGFDSNHSQKFTVSIPSPESTGIFSIGTFASDIRFSASIGLNCNAQSGEMTVREVTRDSGGHLTALAISYVAPCDGGGGDILGEIRIHSSVDYRAATANPGYLRIQGKIDDVNVKPIVFTGAGSAPITFGQAALSGADQSTFTIVSDGCSGVTLAFGQTCSIGISAYVPKGERFYAASLTVPDDSNAHRRRIPLQYWAVTGPRGTYYPLLPQRFMDTRSGLNVAKKPIGPQGVVHLKIGGQYTTGMPEWGIGAVVLNVTVSQPTSNGYLTLYPTGSARPIASSLNFTKGWTGANSVTVAASAATGIDIYNSAGSTQVIIDLVGFYATSPSPQYQQCQGEPCGIGGHFHPVYPQRLLDTRTDWGTKLPADYFAKIPVDYGSANSHIRALVVNVTAVSPRSGGYLTAFDGASYLPETSTLNYPAGKTVPNMATVRTWPCIACGSATGLPAIGVYTSRDTHLLVDIVGFMDDGTLPNGLRFSPVNPSRIVDTRSGQGIAQALGPDETATATVPAALLTDATRAVAFNVTAVAPTAGTYLTVWPHRAGEVRPNVSNLNPGAGQTVPNAAITLLGDGGGFDVFNALGVTNVLVDVVGTFYLYPGTATEAAGAGQGLAGPGAVPSWSLVSRPPASMVAAP